MAGIVRLDTAGRKGAQSARKAQTGQETERAKKARLAAMRAADGFWRSPVGQALQAYQRGDGFFQVQLPHSAVRFNPLGPPSGLTSSVDAGFNKTDVLGQIEEIGWRLIQATWVQVEPAPRPGPPTPTQPAGADDVVGIYLFRRDQPHYRPVAD
ncbi:hypothetical protein [Mycolicibacterium thermoresistibile]|jgi:hypothetical protein|nr:hypothetical protein [Mycolicibacterium thermoresistibile]MCV7186690.1 hypothetical protein [Mycolicibacterium thermoresistibile]GAT15900.1 putative uncharacterized protein [Mycolicibacterium thermoresistibile]SNW19425.1 Uncharacterised protein [Mycolicibacterium thermoresistibile]